MTTKRLLLLVVDEPYWNLRLVFPTPAPEPASKARERERETKTNGQRSCGSSSIPHRLAGGGAYLSRFLQRSIGEKFRDQKVQFCGAKQEKNRMPLKGFSANGSIRSMPATAAANDGKIRSIHSYTQRRGAERPAAGCFSGQRDRGPWN